MGFPQHIVEWLVHDEYDYEPGTISATSFLKPPRVHALMKRYWDQLEMDVKHLAASKMGTAIHDSLEKAPMTDVLLKEIRFYHVLNGCRISGKPDLVKRCNTLNFQGKLIIANSDSKVVFEEEGSGQHGEYKAGHLKDYKTTSVWSFIKDSKDDHYTKQLSIYRYLMFHNRIVLDDLGEIDFFFTDWQKKKAKDDESYPQSKIFWKMFSLMPLDEVEKFLLEKIEEFRRVEALPDDELPECTREDLWMENDEYAVMKKGRKSAVRLLSSEEEAKAYMEAKGLNEKIHYIEFRPAQAKRCNPYCPVRKWCKQYLKMKEAGIIVLEEEDD